MDVFSSSDMGDSGADIMAPWDHVGHGTRAQRRTEGHITKSTGELGAYRSSCSRSLELNLQKP